jgi:hypothetical protein
MTSEASICSSTTEIEPRVVFLPGRRLVYNVDYKLKPNASGTVLQYVESNVQTRELNKENNTYKGGYVVIDSSGVARLTLVELRSGGLELVTRKFELNMVRAHKFRDLCRDYTAIFMPDPQHPCPANSKWAIVFGNNGRVDAIVPIKPVPFTLSSVV